MLRIIPLIALALSGCGWHPKGHDGSSVTVKLPPPKPVSTPGFSTAMSDPLP